MVAHRRAASEIPAMAWRVTRAGGCTTSRSSDPTDLDDEVAGWVAAAYDTAPELTWITDAVGTSGPRTT